MKYVPRNKYFELIGKLGVKKTESEYEIADLDLSAYALNEDTKRIANVNFMKETEDRWTLGFRFKLPVRKEMQIRFGSGRRI